MQIRVVIELVKGGKVYVTSMRFIHYLHNGKCPFRGAKRGTDLEAYHPFYTTEGLDDHDIHVQKSILEELLDRFRRAIRRCDLQFRSKRIAAPKARSTRKHTLSPLYWCVVELHLRHGSSGQLLVATWPDSALRLDMAATLDSEEPRRT